jgi:hypothetical protein
VIECALIERPEWISSPLSAERKKRKLGRYHRSYFSDVPGYGRTAWVVMAGICCDVEGLLEQGKTVVEIVKECIDYLNELPIRKRKTKRKRKPLYGKLDFYKAQIKEGENGEKYIAAMIITDQRKNKHFWGEGNIINARKRKRRTKKTD